MQDFKQNTDLIKVVKSRKRKYFLAKWGVTLPMGLEALISLASLLGGIGTPMFFSLSTVLMGVIGMALESRAKSYDQKQQFLEDLSSEIGEKIGNRDWCFYTLKDIAIVPKNIKVGENGESINFAPIYKDGKFIIIRGDYSLEMLFQYDDEGTMVVKILDRDEVFEEYDKLSDKEKKKVNWGNRKLLSLGIRD